MVFRYLFIFRALFADCLFAVFFGKSIRCIFFYFLIFVKISFHDYFLVFQNSVCNFSIYAIIPIIGEIFAEMRSKALHGFSPFSPFFYSYFEHFLLTVFMVGF